MQEVQSSQNKQIENEIDWDTLPNTDPRHAERLTDLRLEATREAERRLWSSPDDEQFEVEMQKAFVASLDSQPWSAEERKLELGDSYTDKLTPFNLELTSELPFVANFANYGMTGRSSENHKIPASEQREPTRVANGWLSELKSDAGDTIVSLFRSATLSSFGTDNPEEARTASTAMGRELLTVIAAKTLSNLDHESRERVLSGEMVLPLNIASFDLQSRFDAVIPNEHLSLEHRTVDEQREIFRALEGEQELELTIPLPGRGITPLIIKAEVKTFLFNFATHHRGFRDGSGFTPLVQQRNLEEVESLVEWIETHGSEDMKERAKALEVAVASGSYTEPGDSPYKVNVELALLAYDAGMNVHANCRSGKDRTGMFDAELKLLALRRDAQERYDIQGNLSDRLSEDESELLFEIAAHGGGARIQRLNTGVPGSKLKEIRPELGDADPMVRRIGRRNWAEFRGHANNVSA